MQIPILPRKREGGIRVSICLPFIFAGLLAAQVPTALGPAKQVPPVATPGLIGIRNGQLTGDWAKWQKLMSQKPLPGPGCYTATYPQSEWTKTQCKLAPPYPLTVGAGTNGSGTDSVAQVSSGSIGSATGSFDFISGLTSENDSGNAFTFGGTNDFSLQVNTNQFPTTTANAAIQKNGTSINPCTASGSPGCTGWEQFVLTNYASLSPIGTNLYMQFWLIGYQNSFGTCPSSQIPGGWESGLLGQWRTSNGSCFINGPAASVPIQNITNLSQLFMTGTVNLNGLDVAMLFTPTQVFTIGLPTNFVGMDQSWTQAEFNVFGLWNSSVANFNSGTTITVNNAVTGPGGAGVSASCGSASFTGETNNLNLPPCQCFSSGAQISFTESNASSPVCSCANGASWNQSTSSCSCNVAGQVMDSTTGQCSCPATGQIVQNNQCTCSASGAVPINGACACQYPGQTVQNNVCNCSIPGQAVINGACACYGGQNLVNNACVCPSGTTWNASSMTCVCNTPGQVLVSGQCITPKNECGGTAVLTQIVGSSCGTSCGRWSCNGQNALKCQTYTNVCGGCAALPSIPGAGPQPGETCSCGNGKSGRYACTASKELGCDCAP